MTSNPFITTLVCASMLAAAMSASAQGGPKDERPPAKSGSHSGPVAVAATRVSSSTRTCRADEDTLRVLRLTTFEGGVRVDYEFVVSGRATWTNMNRPLLKQFGVRAAGTFCLPKDARADDGIDYE